MKTATCSYFSTDPFSRAKPWTVSISAPDLELLDQAIKNTAHCYCIRENLRNCFITNRKDPTTRVTFTKPALHHAPKPSPQQELPL